MANIDKTDFWWNGKLSGAINLLYSDLLNVDVVKPAYSWWNRNSSFFLQTRLWYICEPSLYQYLSEAPIIWSHPNNWKIDDIKAIYDTSCSEESWTVYILLHNLDDNFRALLTTRIEDWCVTLDFNPTRTQWWETCDCWDWKLFKTNSPRGESVDVIKWWAVIDWIQVNILEWWVYRWYFTTDWILSWEDEWWDIWVWDYLVITDSSNNEWSWFAWQTRMVVWFSDDNKYLILDTPWNWFAVADENWNTYKRVEWKDVSATAFKEEWEVVWLSRWNLIDIFTNWASYITYQPTLWCIISITESNGRIFALYNNWYVRYSRVWWRDEFFFDDEMYAWTDKTSLYAYRDFILAFGKRSISVWTPTEFNNQIFYTMYQQSWTIGLKSRYSYWEHNWNLIFVSNDNRLMSLWVAATSWKYMLSFEDIWQEIIWWKLSSMLDSDEAFIADYNNELRVLVQTKPNPNKADSKNSQTHIYKFDNQFKIWTEDHLENILMSWYTCWVWYWVWWIYIRWLVEVDSYEGWEPEDYSIVDNWRWWQSIDFRESPTLSVSDMKYKPNPVVAKVWAFLVENEQNWISTQASKAPDLFNLVKLNRLIVTLGYWSYSDENTKIKITSYREWIWVITEVKTLQTNDWINLISHSYMWEELPEELIEKKECLLQSINEWQTWYIQECTAKDLSVIDLIEDKPRCEWTKKTNYQDHNICIDSSLYELSPHMPLTINVWSTQNYSSQVKVEIISKSWDILNFGWFLAELFVAPVGVKWADWENLIEMSSC